jgi:hypothetical protein
VGDGALVTRRAAAAVLAFVLAGCGEVLQSPPTHAPESFPEIASQLGRFGVEVSSWVSGDAGCSDASLSPTAIRFDAVGLDQPTAVPLRIYIFRNRETWERRRADVDACVAEWADDPGAFEFVDPSPYVLAGPGPWPEAFEAAVRRALDEASGSGG